MKNFHIARGENLTEAQDRVISSNKNILDVKTDGFRDSKRINIDIHSVVIKNKKLNREVEK